MDREYESDTLVPGTIYRVVREIGRGGMGRVYEVEDTTVGKRYAMKILLDVHARRHPDIVDRMRQESRILARIAHPNIVDVITAGVTGDGHAYYVMAFLHGSSLRKILAKRKRIDALEVVSIGIDVAEALEKAHREGVVHRDIKPDNVFIEVRSDMTTHAVVMDFGVAGEPLDLRRHADEAGRLFGTPRYASPEQQRGERVTPKMDLWALGITLFESLVGHMPFKGRSLPEIIKAVQGREPAARVSDFLPVDPRLDDLLAKMLDKDAARRVDLPRAIAELKEIQRVLQALEQPHDDNRTWETLVALAAPTSPGDPAAAPVAIEERAISARTTLRVAMPQGPAGLENSTVPGVGPAKSSSIATPVVDVQFDGSMGESGSLAAPLDAGRAGTPTPNSIARYLDIEQFARDRGEERSSPRERREEPGLERSWASPPAASARSTMTEPSAVSGNISPAGVVTSLIQHPARSRKDRGSRRPAIAVGITALAVTVLGSTAVFLARGALAPRAVTPTQVPAPLPNVVATEPAPPVSTSQLRPLPSSEQLTAVPDGGAVAARPVRVDSSGSAPAAAAASTAPEPARSPRQAASVRAAPQPRPAASIRSLDDIDRLLAH